MITLQLSADFALKGFEGAIPDARDFRSDYIPNASMIRSLTMHSTDTAIWADDLARWNAVLARDTRADGHFVFAVSSTGIYCRPSCPARHPRRDRVSFFAGAEAARAAGFRACLRCRPDEPPLQARHTALVTEACRLLKEADEPLRLSALAAALGVSPTHLQRLFRQHTGVTPAAYAAALRAARLRQTLPGAATITEALNTAGYGSHAGFHADAPRRLGMPPGRYRKGGVDTDIRFAVGQSSLGAILVAASPAGICSIALGDNPARLVAELQERFPRARLCGDDPTFSAHLARVAGLVDNPALGADLPLDIRGTAFQQRVWAALTRIPPGSTLSYTELAESLGMPRAVRAVAGACAANTLAIAIPCHRVVRNDGALAGYRWGIERKAELLHREQADVTGDASGSSDGSEQAR